MAVSVLLSVREQASPILLGAIRRSAGLLRRLHQAETPQIGARQLLIGVRRKENMVSVAKASTRIVSTISNAPMKP